MLKIGTRGSKLALCHAEFTQAELRRIGVESEIVLVKQGKRASTKKMEEALLQGAIDLAVYSMKALPTRQPEGLVITAVSSRGNPAELLLIRPESVDATQIFKLKHGAVVGTTAARRKAQLLDFRPDTEVHELRGNARFRLKKLRAGKVDAIILPAAVVDWIGLELKDVEVLELNPREFIPAPAQGVLAWLTHRDDLPTRRLLKQLHHPETSAVTNVERKALQVLGDALPLGVFVERDGTGNYHAFAACARDGRLGRTRLSQNTSAGLAEKLAAALLEK
jgi:hydroxymethylbilane synthase